MFLVRQSNINISTALKSDTIAQLNKEDEVTLQTSISNLLFMLNESLNYSTKLSAIQAIEITYHITQNYPGLRIDELILCFKNGKAGVYGNKFFKIDIMTINSWILEYLSSEERLSEIERQYQRSKDQLNIEQKSTEEDIKCDPMRVVKIFDKFIESRKVEKLEKMKSSRLEYIESLKEKTIEKVKKACVALNSDELRQYMNGFPQCEYDETFDLIEAELAKREKNQ